MVLGCDTSAERFAACKSMLDHGFASYAVIEPQMENVAAVPVKLGKEREVRAVPAGDSALLIDKSQKASVTTEIQLTEEVTAPVSQGQRLGTMTVRSGEQVLAQIPLVAERSVSRLSFGELFVQMVQRLCMARTSDE